MPGDAKDHAAADSSTAVVAEPATSLLAAPMPSASLLTAMPYSRGLDSHTPKQEKAGNKLAKARAANAKAYLVNDKRIDAIRVTVYTGSQDGKIVYATLIPAGATFDSAGDTLEK